MHIHFDGILGSIIALTNCDYISYSLLDIPYTQNDHFYLKFNKKDCLIVVNNTFLVLGECGKDGTTFYHEGPKHGIKYYNRGEKDYSGMLRRGWVDGFSDPISAAIGIKTNYKAVFEPSGYGHDSCYFCKNSKSGCDEALLKNMSKLCWNFYKGYNYSYNPFWCEEMAAVVFGLISVAPQSQEGYNSDQGIMNYNRHNITENRYNMGGYCLCESYDYENFVNENYLVLEEDEYNEMSDEEKLNKDSTTFISRFRGLECETGSQKGTKKYSDEDRDEVCSFFYCRNCITENEHYSECGRFLRDKYSLKNCSKIKLDLKNRKDRHI